MHNVLIFVAALVASSAFAITPTDLDASAFAQHVAGKESPMAEAPTAVVWTSKTKPEYRGVKFGQGREGRVRHLRIGFVKEVKVGSGLVSGGGSLSVLKPTAMYPGDLSDDSQWISAERLVNGEVSHAEVAEGSYALWVLPPNTKTRALRFSHTPAAGDREMAGVLGGVWIESERLGNVSPQALVQSRARDDVSARLVDESNNKTWQAWDNGEDGGALPVSMEHPEILTLMWPKAVAMNGLCLLWTGFQSCEVDAFIGADDANVREASASNWHRAAVGTKLEAWYPLPLGPNWIAFDEKVRTRALRLRITDGAKANHPHLTSKLKDGKRVWLGELMALVPLGEAPLTSIVLPKASEEPPPIPIKFTLPEAGQVTLVIEDKMNHRVRNLVSETPFPAGENTAWWDGSDDLLRDPEAARHGVHHIPTRPVAPGDYKVRGLWHRPLSLHYEFSIYNAGKPAWSTADNTGCWLTTHTPPTSMAFVPGSKTADGQGLIFMGCYVAEGGHGLQWLHEDCTKIGGQHWVGGTWTGAPTLAVDNGKNAIADHLCYIGSVWEGELRITAKTRDLVDKPVFKVKLGDDPKLKENDPNNPPVLEGFDGGQHKFVLGSIAAHDGTIVCSMVRQNELIVIDPKTGTIRQKNKVDDLRGVAFDTNGQLLVLSGNQLMRWADKLVPLISSELEDPRHVFTTSDRVFISDRGAAHQVKVFDASGKFLHAIGKPGVPSVGTYDPLHMNNPNGLTLDSRGRLWVAEADNYPRRVSVWTQQGELVRTFYGPTEYGGGGVLDSQDATKFFYKGMEFALDWKTGTDKLVRVFWRPTPLMEAHGGHYSPDHPLYPSGAQGTRYFTSCYTHNPTGGDNAAFIWRDAESRAEMSAGGLKPRTRSPNATPNASTLSRGPGLQPAQPLNAAQLVAGVGDAHHWRILRTAEFRSLWPEGTTPHENNPPPEKRAAFIWCDKNNDGKPDPDEVKMTKEAVRGVTVSNDLSLLVSRFGEKTVRFVAKRSSAVAPRLEGAKTPVAAQLDYSFPPEVLGPAGGVPPSSGGNQTLIQADWLVHTNAPQPFSPFGIGGSYQSEPRWSYPSAWPGLHASHEAAVPDRPGMVVGHTRLLGDMIKGKAGPMFCINGNMGNMYLFTVDGLFVSTLFNDIRLRPNWAAPVATRNMDVTDVSLHDENFWPSITQTPDGKVFLVDGARTSLVRVDGLETVQRLPEQTITVTASDLDKCRNWFARAEASRQKARGTGVLKVAMRTHVPVVDGKLDDWPATTDWASIDHRGTKANFNSNSMPYEVSAAVAIGGDKLFAAWRTTEKDLLNNSGETPNALFKTGGCLDVMLQTDTDQRLLVTLIKGKPRALLYRAQVPGTKQPIAFSSPWRTINIDVVEDVTESITFAADGTGNYEISVPLAALHWQPKANDEVKADLGVLRGSNGQTTQRVYWSNKATAITADVPSEAELTPKLWGKWRVQ